MDFSEMAQLTGKVNYAAEKQKEKKMANAGIIGNAVGQGLSAIGNIVTGIFGGGTQTATDTGGGSRGVPVNVGVDSSTKKWITYAGIAGGALLLIIVLILAFRKK